jgi:integrase
VAGKRGNGEGAISRRKDGRWEGRYTTESNRRSVYGKTKREIAQKLARTISGKEHAPAFFLPTNVTVAEFFTQYEDAVTDMMKRRSFETCCKVARVHLLPAFGGLRLKELNCEHVQRLYSRKRDAGLSAARARRIHGVLSSALNHAVRWRLVEHNVCKEVRPIPYPLRVGADVGYAVGRSRWTILLRPWPIVSRSARTARAHHRLRKADPRGSENLREPP